MRNDERGFTWLEVLMVTILTMLLIIIILPTLPHHHGGSSREAETKANVHTIQIALERYYTDHGDYPPYLLGGDIRGWQNWHEKWDGVNNTDMGDGRIASNDVVVDPLIESGYVNFYPDNPYIEPGNTNIIEWTTLNGSKTPGDGDPRFGWNGSVMGNCLDDPAWFCGSQQEDPSLWSEIETRRTLDHGDWMNVPENYRSTGAGPYYLAGGMRDPGTGEPVMTFWPGEFFYRAIPDQNLLDENGSLRQFPFTGVNEPAMHYILGGYGNSNTAGMDVIRIEPANPDGYRLTWRYPENYPDDFQWCGCSFKEGPGSACGLPAVFGGGDETTGPAFPYIDVEGEILYGAPDGIRDGIILVLDNKPRIPSYWQG